MSHKGKAWLKLILITALLLITSISFASKTTGDLNSDGNVDKDDLNILLEALGEKASGPDDLRDLNGDGKITGRDTRILIDLCDQPGCAEKSGSSGDDEDEDDEKDKDIDTDKDKDNEDYCKDKNKKCRDDDNDDCKNDDKCRDDDDHDDDDCDEEECDDNGGVVDIVNPLVLITSPAEGNETSTTNIQITGNASDETSLAGVTVNGITATLSGNLFTATVALTDGSNTITAIATDSAGNTASSSITVTLVSVLPPPTISSFNPTSISNGELLTISGTNFAAHSGAQPVVSLSKQGGGTVNAPVADFDALSATITVPASATTGPLNITVDGQTVTSTSSLTIAAASDFTLNAAPAALNILQGKTASLSVSIASANNFSQLVKLDVSGLPAGVSASFDPEQVAAGQSSLLTISTPANQTAATSSITIAGTATVDGINLNQTASVALTVEAVTTAFIGRTVVADAKQTALAGVTVELLGQDGDGGTTSCSGTTTSDSAGNFTFTNLPDGCVGAQLVRYDGSTVTSPAGEYAGVDLVNQIIANQVAESPVLIHLPRIDDGETVGVIQNHSLDQTFRFATIPNLSVTIYAGTTILLEDGSQPDPFPLTAVEVPIDRLPDEMPPEGGLTPFIVAFQPANATASQPIAVTFPNLINIPPATNLTLMTLDPTKGTMVSYGTGTVSDDGLKIVPDADPANPGKRFGLVHFDWHGPAGPAPNQNDPCPNGPCLGDPVHLSSGLVLEQRTDLAMPAPGGGISIQRSYRTMSANAGPFGIGWNHNYSYFIAEQTPTPNSAIINFVVPTGNRFPFFNNGGGIFTNTTEPSLSGVVIEVKPGRVVDVTFKNGTVFHFAPTREGFVVGTDLQTITDLNGNTTTLVRNLANFLQITEIIDSVGRKFQLSYGSGNRISEIRDPIGRVVSYSYTSFGRLQTVTDPEGGVTRYSYVRPTASSELNQLETITDARGIVIARNFYGSYYGPACNGATGLSDDDLAAMSVAARTACLDDLGTVQDERVWKQIAADGGATHFRYTLANQSLVLSPVIQTAATNALGHTTVYRFSTQGQPLGVTDPAGQSMVFEREPGTNQLLAIRGNASCEFCGDISGGDSSQTVDSNGNILISTDAQGNVSRFSYELRLNKLTLVTNALGHSNSFNYDAKGNLLSSVDANSNVTNFKYNSRGLPVEAIDALANKTRLSYDTSSNLIKTTDAKGNAIQFSYDAVGRVVEVVDAQGRRSKITYDQLNRVISQTDAKQKQTVFSYDTIGNLLSLTDARGNTVSFTYDEMNRVATRTDAASQVETFEYNLTSDLIKSTDRRGQITEFIYDKLSRLITTNYTDGSVINNSYDARGRLIRTEDSAGGVQTFEYDTLGRLINESAANGAISYQYDKLGQIVSRQVAGQEAVTYTYDAAGNLVAASDAQTNVNFSLDALNRRTDLQRGNGVVTSQSFDALSRVLAINHSNAAGVIDQQTYTYDDVGNRKSLANTIGTPYVTPPATANYDQANRLIQRGDFTYSYDENGNRLTKTGLLGTTNYSWDSRNRLIGIIEPDGKTTDFIYDVFNNLISQQVTGSANNLDTAYLVDISNNVIQQNSSNGEVLSILTGIGIDDHLAVTHSDGTLGYILRDALNSTVATTDSSGAVGQPISYEPYGQLSSVTTTFPIQYTGRLPVSDGLYYYRARFYDPEAGRFLNEDPIGLAGGVNSYGYVFQNPILFTDPTGKNPLLFFAAIATAGTITLAKKCSSGIDNVSEGFKAASERRSALQERADCTTSNSLCSEATVQTLTDTINSADQRFRSNTVQAIENLGTSVPGTTITGPIPTRIVDVVNSTIVNTITSSQNNE